jgi:hypothetical protein
VWLREQVNIADHLAPPENPPPVDHQHPNAPRAFVLDEDEPLINEEEPHENQPPIAQEPAPPNNERDAERIVQGGSK